jgi:site-specific DNA-cytosine methylase
VTTSYGSDKSVSTMNIECFSCAGGMAEGFRRAGIEFHFAFDFAKDHCESYARNIGHKPVCIDVRDLLRLARAGLFGSLDAAMRPSIDLFVADPPCTPWSRAGLRKGTADERDMLEDTCELIRLLRPRAYLIGNVPGLDDSKNWSIVQRVIGGLSKHGYCTADFAALDAVNYGVPQHRVRPFWFGHLDGPCIQWPEPTHCDPEQLTTLTLPGLAELKAWVTCRQALGHLPPHELGRPVRLRRRACNGKQHGSVHDRPARVVGTSNLSDGNVLLADSSKHPALSPDEPATTVRGGGDHGHSAPPLVLLNEKHPPADLDRPSPVVTAKPRGPGGQLMNDPAAPRARKPRKSRSETPFEGGYTPSELDAPAKAVVKNTHGNGAVLKYDLHHPPHDIDKPANVIRAGDGQGGNRAMRVASAVVAATLSAGEVEIEMDPKHPPHDADAPANLIRASDGGGSGSVLRQSKRRKRDEGRPGQGMRVGKADTPGKTVTAKASRVGAGESHVLEWPWDRPSTVVAADDRLAPPGHHDENWDGGTRSVEGAVVLSEKAAAILQGFPADWHFEGRTKKARWSQIGQAMPPPLAHAVARSVAAQMRAARDRDANKDLPPPSLATGKLTVV